MTTLSPPRATRILCAAHAPQKPYSQYGVSRSSATHLYLDTTLDLSPGKATLSMGE